MFSCLHISPVASLVNGASLAHLELISKTRVLSTTIRRLCHILHLTPAPNQTATIRCRSALIAVLATTKNWWVFLLLLAFIVRHKKRLWPSHRQQFALLFSVLNCRAHRRLLHNHYRRAKRGHRSPELFIHSYHVYDRVWPLFAIQSPRVCRNRVSNRWPRTMSVPGCQSILICSIFLEEDQGRPWVSSYRIVSLANEACRWDDNDSVPVWQGYEAIKAALPDLPLRSLLS